MIALIIEKAIEDDAAQILELQKLAYQSEAVLYNNYSIEPLTQTLDETIKDFKEKIVIKAVLDSKIIGSVRAVGDGMTCYIEKLFVHPDFQNQGVGSKLMSEIEKTFEDTKRYELFTGHLSRKNLCLYEKLGYHRIKTERATDTLSFVTLEKRFHA